MNLWKLDTAVGVAFVLAESVEDVAELADEFGPVIEGCEPEKVERFAVCLTASDKGAQLGAAPWVLWELADFMFDELEDDVPQWIKDPTGGKR